MLNFLKRFFKPKADLNGLVKEGAVIIDVRTMSEFKDGHMKGSINIPLNNLSNELGRIKGFQKPIITVCRSGSRSQMAKSTLTAAGMEVHNGGAWSSLQRKIQ